MQRVVSATNPRLFRTLLRLAGKPSADPRDVHRRLERALERAQANATDVDRAARPVQAVGELHTPASYRRWRQTQLRRLPGAFVPEVEEGQLPVVLWALKPAGLADFLRRGRTKTLLSPPSVGVFAPAVDGEVALAGVLAGWLEQQPEASLRLAPPLLRRSGQRSRLVLPQYAWALPASELLAAAPAA